MLCCICKEKEAKVHLTQIAGDKMQKVDLCEECAKTKGVNDPTGFSLADLLLGLGASQEIEQAAGGAELKCSRCGFTQADFKKAGRLGCPECYKTFAELAQRVMDVCAVELRDARSASGRSLNNTRIDKDEFNQAVEIIEKARNRKQHPAWYR